MNAVHMVDQAPRCEARPESNEAKRDKARAYLKTQGISLQLHSGFRYVRSDIGNKVLGSGRIRRKAPR